MANAPLTMTQVTREILRIAHEELSFIGTTQRTYDDQYAKNGAKIGDSLSIRLPNRYTVRTGKDMDVQDTNEASVTLTVATQKGVDIAFSSAELAMELDDYSKRIIRPAVAILASDIEASMLQAVTPKVYNHVGTPGTLPTILQVAKAKAKLNQNLAPKSGRCIQMESVDMAGMVDSLKGLFHDSKEVSKQYREGYVGRSMGLDWIENERIDTHTVGADVTGVAVNNGTLADGMTTLTVDGCSTAPGEGDIFTIDSVFAVHPETKVAYKHLQQFTVTSATTTVITFTPAIYSSTAKQNVSALPANDDALVFVGTASTAYPQHLVYAPEAFAFASADLPMPSNIEGHREVFEGLSMRLLKGYDMKSDVEALRLDILHGYEAIRPEWACRIMGSGA